MGIMMYRGDSEGYYDAQGTQMETMMQREAPMGTIIYRGL